MCSLRMLLGALCLFPLSLVYAEQIELTPQDFYKGAELQVDSPSPFYSVALSDAIYQESVNPDLRDIRVFNSSGQVMTFSLSSAETASVEQKNIPLRIFPMQMTVDNVQDRRSRERVTLKSVDGVEVKLYQDDKNQLGTTYLLQAEQEDLGLNQIVLTWDKPAYNWQCKVKVYSSSDLKKWSKQLDNVPLMDLTSGSDRLLLNHIDLDDNYQTRSARYWLLVIDNGEQAAAPVIAKAEGISITRDKRTETVDLPFKAKVISKTEVEYELARPQPLSSLSILPEQRNTVLPINIEYRNSSDGQWRTLTNTVVYQIEGENGRRTSEPLSFNDLLVQAIRIKAVNGSWGENPPYVVGQRKRVNVIFNAQGNPPYLLVWGSNQVNAATIPIEQLIPPSEIPYRELYHLPTARIMPSMILGGEERLTATSPVEREALWQKWLLWGLLIAGVLILALIVFKLAREVMGNKSQ